MDLSPRGENRKGSREEWGELLQGHVDTVPIIGKLHHLRSPRSRVWQLAREALTGLLEFCGDGGEVHRCRVWGGGGVVFLLICTPQNVPRFTGIVRECWCHCIV